MRNAKSNYMAALDEAIRQLSQEFKKHETLQEQVNRSARRIENLQQAAESIGRLCGVNPVKEYPDLFPDEIEPELGFTDAVRRVFEKGSATMTYDAISVRDALREAGFPIAKYTNPLASIHTILKRLEVKKEIGRIVVDGSVRYARRALADHFAGAS